MTRVPFSAIDPILYTASLLFHSASTLSLHLTASPALPPPPPPPPPDAIIDFNTTSLNTTSTNALEVSCHAAFGSGLVASSCFNALSYSPTGDGQESWGEPGRQVPGTGALDVELPVKVFSDDATCAIVPKTEPHYPLAHAIAHEVTEAARAVIRSCVIARGIGGIARMIGGDNRLTVTVAGFQPHVTCHTAMSAPVRSCEFIMREMMKTEVREKFGQTPDPSIRVALPLTLRAPDGKCQVYIETRSPTIWTSWNDVWEAVETTVAVCVRRGKWGWAAVARTAQAKPRGQDLFVVVTDEPWPPVGLVGLWGNSTNGSTTETE